MFLSFGITVGSSFYGWIDPNAVSEATCRGGISPWFRFIFVSRYIFSTDLAGAGIHILSSGDKSSPSETVSSDAAHQWNWIRGDVLLFSPFYGKSSCQCTRRLCDWSLRTCLFAMVASLAISSNCSFHGLYIPLWVFSN